MGYDISGFKKEKEKLEHMEPTKASDSIRIMASSMEKSVNRILETICIDSPIMSRQTSQISDFETDLPETTYNPANLDSEEKSSSQLLETFQLKEDSKELANELSFFDEIGIEMKEDSGEIPNEERMNLNIKSLDSKELSEQ